MPTPADERAAFLRAVLDDPDDDAPRLVFADWLDEQGRDDEAEFVRVQCELEPLREDFVSERAEALRRREHDLGTHFWQRWRDEARAIFGDRSMDIGLERRRGIVEEVCLPVQWFIDAGEVVWRAYPALRRVTLYRVNGWGARLAACPHLAAVRELELACWFTGADLDALLDSPHLSGLRRLTVWMGRDGLAVRAALARADRLPALEEVETVWERVEPAGSRPRFRFTDPWARPYAFAPGGGGYFDEYFPGRLPDGTMVFGMMPEVRSNLLPLALFGEDGRVREVRRLELPARLVPKRGEYDGENSLAVWSSLVRDITAFLRDELGHRPGLIRVRELPDEWPGVGECPSVVEDRIGVPDDPAAPPESDSEGWAGGYGGFVHGWTATKNFVFYPGNDWWVNGVTGDVEST
jgi:uncharacterized protein (TIGR02996 family)